MERVYEKYPLTLEGFGDFLRKELVGKPESTPGEAPEDTGHHLPVMGGERGLVDENTAIAYSLAIGDDNPLYTDPLYGRKTRWGWMVVTPVITNIIRYLPPHPRGYGDWPVTHLVGGLGWEWNDMIRPGDKFKTTFYLNELVEKKGSTGRLFITKSDAKYWNQYGDLTAKGWGSQIMIGKDVSVEDIREGKGFRDAMLYERPTYHYSKEEVQKIEDGINAEKRRGAEILYWEDVHVGDKLTPLVKGPLTMGDLMGFAAMLTAGGHSVFELSYRSSKKASRSPIENSSTGWPYENMWMEHYDFYLCKDRGLPGPFDEGQMRCCTPAHLLSNWMGDNGFIRRLGTSLRKPNFYGDTQWVYGEVVKTYKDKVGDEEYGAVDIRIDQINQVGENTAPGTATVYLPSPDKPVKIPIPHESHFEDYDKYLEDCEKKKVRMKELGYL